VGFHQDDDPAVVEPLGPDGVEEHRLVPDPDDPDDAPAGDVDGPLGVRDRDAIEPRRGRRTLVR
jgi:hypothetical protein